MVLLGTFVDNVDVDVATGHLWVAGHTDGNMVLNYLTPPHTARSPSQVQWTPRSRMAIGQTYTIKQMIHLYGPF